MHIHFQRWHKFCGGPSLLDLFISDGYVQTLIDAGYIELDQR